MERIGAASRRHRRPHAQGFEDLPRAVAERRGALIEARLRGRIRRHALDEQHAQLRRAQRQREARADHAAADDRDVVLFHAGLSRDRRHQPLDLDGVLGQRRR